MTFEIRVFRLSVVFTHWGLYFAHLIRIRALTSIQAMFFTQHTEN